MILATSITKKVQGEGTPEAFDSWFIKYENELPEMVLEDPGTLEVFNKYIQYDHRAKDGLKAYLKLISEFVVSGTSREVNKSLESKLETVRNEIVNGQWVTALEKLELISPTGDLTTEIYDRVHLSLTTYIANNY